MVYGKKVGKLEKGWNFLKLKNSKKFGTIEKWWNKVKKCWKQSKNLRELILKKKSKFIGNIEKCVIIEKNCKKKRKIKKKSVGKCAYVVKKIKKVKIIKNGENYKKYWKRRIMVKSIEKYQIVRKLKKR